MMATVAIVGASGYAGQETLDRVLRHQGLELSAPGSDPLEGQPPWDIDPRLGRNRCTMPGSSRTNSALVRRRPHVSLSFARRGGGDGPPTVVIDLRRAPTVRCLRVSAVVRPSTRGPGPAAGSFGLPELNPPSGRLIANPGCYSTAVLLALAPIAGAIEPTGVVVDAKSGTTGAGRTPRASSHAGTVLENVTPYRVGEHQHAPEIAQELGFPVTFVPHCSRSVADSW
jgi:N-acetyl-gamma-glutamyl-phosphate reductase